jgi:isopentenyl diphosphate isomerase/L-lactate dehydrogenase-like FMN-dependent dehydrogenase
VRRAIEILRTEIERALKLLGCSSIAALDRSYVNVSAFRRERNTENLPA